MIAVIDYGAGNLFSVSNALAFLQIPHKITQNPAEIQSASGLLLPGVGAFPDAMRRLQETHLTDLLREQAEKKPFLGICLGMQVMFSSGEEFEKTNGLGLLPGVVKKIQAPGQKIPHMGWNRLEMKNPCPLTKNLPQNPYVYFVHSYYADAKPEQIVATAEYGGEVPALVFRGRCFGAQFHPEKSGDVGLAILKNFAQLCEQ